MVPRQAAWALQGELADWKIPDVITSFEKHSENVLDQYRKLKSNSQMIDTINF